MKYDYAYFHQTLLNIKSLDYEGNHDMTDEDILLGLLQTPDFDEYNEIDWSIFSDRLMLYYTPPTAKELRKDPFLEFAPKSYIEELSNNIIGRVEQIRFLTYMRDNAFSIFTSLRYPDYDNIAEVFEDTCAQLLSYNLRQSKRDKYHGNVKRVTHSDLVNIIVNRTNVNSSAEELLQVKEELEQLKKRHLALHEQYANLQAKCSGHVSVRQGQEKMIAKLQENNHILDKENHQLQEELFYLKKELSFNKENSTHNEVISPKSVNEPQVETFSKKDIPQFSKYFRSDLSDDQKAKIDKELKVACGKSRAGVAVANVLYDPIFRMEYLAVTDVPDTELHASLVHTYGLKTKIRAFSAAMQKHR